MAAPTGQVSASRHRRRGYTGDTVPIGVITFHFDPLLRLADEFVVRWQTLALAVVLLAVLLVTALAARRHGLRSDDLLSIVVAAVPGAVVGGRLGYLVAHPDAFTAGSMTLLDPAVGGLELGLGVVGGLVTASYVAWLLGASVRAWADVAALPLLVAIGAGKLVMVAGGSGQGLPTDVAWATAYLGAGPWGSLAPELASHPAQAYEGIGTLAIATVFAMAGLAGFAATGGRLLIAGIAAWAVVRAIASSTWRDEIAPGPLPVGGWLAVAIAAAAVVLLLWVTWADRRAAGRVAVAGTDAGRAELDWPDPATRPRF